MVCCNSVVFNFIQDRKWIKATAQNARPLPAARTAVKQQNQSLQSAPVRVRNTLNFFVSNWSCWVHSRFGVLFLHFPIFIHLHFIALKRFPVLQTTIPCDQLEMLSISLYSLNNTSTVWFSLYLYVGRLIFWKMVLTLILDNLSREYLRTTFFWNQKEVILSYIVTIVLPKNLLGTCLTRVRGWFRSIMLRKCGCLAFSQQLITNVLDVQAETCVATVSLEHAM